MNSKKWLIFMVAALGGWLIIPMGFHVWFSFFVDVPVWIVVAYYIGIGLWMLFIHIRAYKN